MKRGGRRNPGTGDDAPYDGLRQPGCGCPSAPTEDEPTADSDGERSGAGGGRDPPGVKRSLRAHEVRSYRALVGQIAVGGTFGRYRIDGLLGRGAMGVVHRAVDTRLDRRVALKLIAPQWADDPHFHARFLREARSAAAIDHPHIVPVYDAGEQDGRLFLAMRYLDGGDLRSVVRSLGRLEPARVGRLAGQLASALDAAHRRGIVHRDVKPGNVLLAGDDGPDHLYLADFGVARPVTAATRLTGDGGLVGSLAYLAPEVIDGAPGSPASDRYAFACLLFELLCGRPPFDQETEAALLRAHLDLAPPTPSALRGDLGPAVDAALAVGLAKDPAARPATCAELVARTGLGAAPAAADGRRPAALRGTSTVTRAPTAPAPTHAPAREEPSSRPRRPALAAAAVVTSLVAGGLVGTALAGGDDPAPAAALRAGAARLVLPAWTTSEGRTARSADGIVTVTLRTAAARAATGTPLRIGAVTVLEAIRRRGDRVTVAEWRPTTGPAAGVACTGRAVAPVRSACRTAIARVRLDGVRAVTPTPYPRVAARAIARADGRAADRAALATTDADRRHRAARRLAAGADAGAAVLASTAPPPADASPARALAAGLRARRDALRALARATTPAAERAAAAALRAADRRLRAAVRTLAG